jgi:hypothetical protein
MLAANVADLDLLNGDLRRSSQHLGPARPRESGYEMVLSRQETVKR